MNPYKVAFFSVLLIATGIFSGCSRSEIDMETAPPLSTFAWGSNSKKAMEKVQSKGWNLISSSDTSAEFTLPVDELKDFKESKIVSDEIPMPYRIHIYFDNDVMSMARIIRRDTTEQIDTFVKNTMDQYSLKTPAWTSDEHVSETESGNKISETVSIYDTGSELIKIFRVRVQPVLEKLKGDMHDDAEIRIFSKEHNPGISVEGLATH